MSISTNRSLELRQMLMARRLELGSVVRSTIRVGGQRTTKDVGDLVRIRRPSTGRPRHVPAPNAAQTVKRIDEALTQLAADRYGICAVCGLEIATTSIARLRSPCAANTAEIGANRTRTGSASFRK